MCTQTLLLLYFVIEDHDTLFILSEIVHMVGISILAHKLLKTKNSGGKKLSIVAFLDQQLIELTGMIVRRSFSKVSRVNSSVSGSSAFL